MKILFVSLNYYPEQTGIGKFQGEMAAWFSGRGHNVRAIAAPPYYPEWRLRHEYSAYRYAVEEIAGVKIYRAPLYVPFNPTGLKRLVHLASFVVTSFPLIIWQTMSWRPDVVVCTAPPLMVSPVVLLASWVSRSRCHIHVQDYEVDAAFDLGLLKKNWLSRLVLGLEKVFLSTFSTASSISQRMCDKLLAKGVHEDKAFLLPNWAGIEDFGPEKGDNGWRNRLGCCENTVLAIYSGNMGKKQGLEVIVGAARKLMQNTNIRFVLSGDGAVREEIIAQSADLENVVFLPVQQLQDFVHLMAAADVHLLPQRAEAADSVMPSKLGNILASHKPVVVGASPGTQLYDAVQGCGLAVPPGDVGAFADAIFRLASDSDMRTEMGARGRERALNEWSKDSILAKFEEVLQG